jgi:hypothetical protein
MRDFVCTREDNIKKIDVFVGLFSQGKEIEFIPINIGEIKYFAQIREKISVGL